MEKLKKRKNTQKNVRYLPEVTVTAPKKWFVGYDDKANPIYTTDYKQSQEYLQNQLPVGNTEQNRRRWAFENVGSNGQVRPGLHGDAADLAKAAQLGIGTALTPLAAGSLVKASMPFMEMMARPSTTATRIGSKLFPSWSKALPYTEMADRGLMGYLGARGMYDAGKGWYNGKMPWYRAIPQMGLSGLMMADAAPVVAKGLNKAGTFMASPYTGKWTTIGNRQYRLSPNTLGMNGVPIESRNFVNELPIDESRYYRSVDRDAFDSYKQTGMISQYDVNGGLRSSYSVPMFTKGKPSEYRIGINDYNKVWVVSKPNAKLEWESVKGAAMSPKVKGEFNKAPISDFDFYVYHPQKGYIKLDENLNLPGGISVSRTPHIDYLKSLSREEQIKYLTENGLNDQWLWTLENNPDHLESTLSKALIPDKTLHITPENAASITPEQWTAAQDAAIARGDMAEAQRLRDLHFKVSTPDNKIVNEENMPFHVYHGTPNNFTTFDPNRINGGNYGKGFYFSPRTDVAQRYATKDGNIMDTYLNLKTEDIFPNDRYGEIIYNDGAIIADAVGRRNLKYAREFRVNRPNQVKSADTVTYDDKGVRIPLGERDNFSLNDIRYGLLPFISLGTLGTMYGTSKKSKGGKINKLKYLRYG